jgi:enoyl-CoA hydratase/carnithine racemase
MLMSGDAVLYESIDKVAVITFNRPDKLNALNQEVCDLMVDFWHRFNAGDDRVAILTGNGRAFTSGADLKDGGEIWPYTPGVGVEVAKPIIAAVNGLAVGGGVVLVQFADLAIAADDAWFSYPEAKIGFTGGLISSMVSRIPHKIAMEFILVGEKMTAQRAYEIGFVNRVVPRDDLMEAAMDYASRLAANAPMVVETLKAFAGRTLPKGPTELAGYARNMTERTFKSEDLKEGLAAFGEKRTPDFRNK